MTAPDPRTDVGRGRLPGLAVPGSAALLIGAGTFTAETGLTDVPAVGRTLRALGEVLVGRCGLAPEELTLIEDPADAGLLGVTIARRVSRVTGVLYLHYIGHGLLGPTGELHLATAGTVRDPTLLPFTTLGWSALREVLRECPAQTVVVVLDCCYSGRAAGGVGDRPPLGLDLAQARGSYVLTSSAADEVSLAPPGHEHTAFTGAMVRLLAHGEPRIGEQLTLGTIFDHLIVTLPAQGWPAPRQFSAGRAERLVLAANPASLTVAAGPDEPDPAVGDAAICPYPGLASFGVDDARFFHGRERLTGELLDRLAGRLVEGGPLVTLGASGSGKSSLLRAGLLPALGRGALPVPGALGWPATVMTPGADPLHSLADAAGALLGRPGADLLDAIRSGPDGLAGQLRAATGRAGDSGAARRVVLVVDQFEEIFTHDVPEADVRAFVDTVHTAAVPGPADEPPAALLVLGVRADFFGRCVHYPALRAALAADPVLVGPMTADELLTAIREPARAVGLQMEPGLAEVLLTDLGVRAGTPYDSARLPLLSHALLTTWRRRRGNRLTVADYRDGGRIDGAVARTAERVYTGLGPADRRTAQQVLLRLVHVGDGTPDTRRRVPLRLLGGHGPERVLAVLAAEDARLVTTDRDTVQITHDALLTAWDRLRGWIAEDRVGRVVQQRATAAAQTWVDGGRQDGDLYTGSRLSAFQERAAGHPEDLTDGEREFLAAGVKAAQRAERVRLRVLQGLSGLLTVALVAGGLAIWQWRTAVSQARAASARSYAGQAAAARDSTPDRAIALGLAAYRTDPSVDTRTALVDSLTRGHLLGLAPNGLRTGTVAFDPVRPLLATGSDGSVRLSSLADRDWGRVLSEPDVDLGDADGLAFSADGALMAASGNAGNARKPLTEAPSPVPEPAALARTGLFDVRDPAHPRRLTRLEGTTRPAFGPAGLLTTVTDRTAVVWDVSTPATPRRLAVLRDPTGPIAALALSRDGRTLATLTAGGLVRLWDLTHRDRPTPGGTLAGVHAAFAPDRDQLAVVSPAGALELWDVADPARPHRLSGAAVPQQNTVTAVGFAPVGGRLAAASQDRSITVWQLGGPRAEAESRFASGQGSALTGLEFSPDGNRLASVDGLSDNARLWRVTPAADPPLIGRVQPGTARQITAVSSGGLVAGADLRGGQVRLYRPGPGPAAEGLRPAGAFTAGLESTSVLTISPDGGRLAVGGMQAQDRAGAQVWDVRDPTAPRFVTAVPATGSAVQDLAFSPDGKTLAVVPPSFSNGPDRMEVALWDLGRPEQPTRTATFDALLNTGHSLAGGGGQVRFGPDGRLLVIGGVERDAGVWDVSDRRHPRRRAVLEHPDYTTDGNPNTVEAVAFSPDGRTVATADDQHVRLWDVRRPDHPRRLAEFDGRGRPSGLGGSTRIDDMTFGTGGRLLGATQGDGSIRLWEVGEPARPVLATELPDHHPVGLRPAAATDIHVGGRLLVSGGADGVLAVRDIGALVQVTTRPLIDWVCSVIGAGFNAKDWKELAPDLSTEQTCPRNS